MKELITYKLKLTTLSPVHIGTGEDFEPTNYVIDLDAEKKPKLYEFNEVDFFKALDAQKRQEFSQIVGNPHYASRFKLYGFIHQNKEIAKKVAFRKVQVLPEVALEYSQKIGKVVQKEGGGKNVFNDFKIAKTYTSPNGHKAVLLGSSLKGSISTAYQEALFKKFKDYDKVKELMLKPNDKNLFKNFIIADAMPTKQGTFVGYAVNIKRNKETPSQSLKPKLEAISSSSEFQTTITCKVPLVFEEIAKSCNDHYFPLFKSQFDSLTDECVRSALSDTFLEKYEKWAPSQNQFLLKVGKHSGARAVTVDGIRSIKIMQGRDKRPIYLEHETTAWLRGGIGESLQPFGWVLCEIIDG